MDLEERIWVLFFERRRGEFVSEALAVRSLS